MKSNDNQERAKKAVEGWPSWKKEISLTKYSCPSSQTDITERKKKAVKK